MDTSLLIARETAQPAQALPGWQATILDEMDYGIVLLSAQLRLLYCNPAARRELKGEHPLELVAGTLRARLSGEDQRLSAALRAAARQGLRRMVTFEAGERAIAVAVVPIPKQDEADEPTILVMLGRSRVCESLSVQGFASCVGLTPAEREVLAQLSAHRRPAGIAQVLGVSLSTVRTHLTNIRLKTGAASIAEVLALLARLPPLTSMLRH